MATKKELLARAYDAIDRAIAGVNKAVAGLNKVDADLLKAVADRDRASNALRMADAMPDDLARVD